ncbi:hypothetical protein BDB00DRAFT_874356 [Zychaea mexicana]|uniref:uncharacterized protein n=1 Tax=Zychaea mexicana TaxID=64656 RepID=UPI0022FEA9F4|nr:uncharacterized protein BDB00DRAFT_874356 [Zychaea mexicana]KAI9491459.1 hypothetical protein BDB00DRAFT_874356 [Zychaea mexicana]
MKVKRENLCWAFRIPSPAVVPAESALHVAPNEANNHFLIEYFDNNENATLEDFVRENKARLRCANSNVKQYWTGLSHKVSRDLKRQVLGTPDWGSVYEFLYLNAPVAVAAVGPATDDATKSCRFLVQMREAHRKMQDKWVLPSGACVENEMVNYCSTLDFQHYILDTNDSCWENVFSDEDLKYIRTHSLPKIASVEDEDVISYIRSLKDKKTYNEIMMHLTRHAPYTDEEKYDITWLRQSVMNLASNYRSNFLIKAAENKEALATSEGRNMKRTLKERKLHRTRVDLRFVYDGVEIACGEAGRKSEGERGTKEMHESQLKCPKTLRDMFVSLAKKYTGTKQDVITFGFIMMGFSISLLFMDCPGRSVCRLTRLPKYHVTTDIDAFTDNVLPILDILLQVKHTMLRVIKAARSSKPPPADLASTHEFYIPFSASPSRSSVSKSLTSDISGSHRTCMEDLKPTDDLEEDKQGHSGRSLLLFVKEVHDAGYDTLPSVSIPNNLAK